MAQSKVPPNLCLNGKNAAQEWKFWKQQFQDFMIMTGGESKEDRIKVAILRNIMGPEACKVVTTFPLEEVTYENLMNSIENYVSPRSSTVVSRFKFNKRIQQEAESFEHFLSECRQLLKEADYQERKEEEKLSDQILRDKIVCGIHDKRVQESLLKMDNLCLEKAISFCRANEQSNMKVQTINSMMESNLNLGDISQKQTEIKKNYRKHKRCGYAHPPRQCPAYVKKWAPCTK